MFIATGIGYGSLAFDKVNNATLGFLVRNKWLKSPVPGTVEKDWLGPKPTILLYSLILIALGIFMLVAGE